MFFWVARRKFFVGVLSFKRMDLYECSILIIGYLQIILLTMWSLYLHFAERISQQKIWNIRIIFCTNFCNVSSFVANCCLKLLETNINEIAILWLLLWLRILCSYSYILFEITKMIRLGSNVIIKRIDWSKHFYLLFIQGLYLKINSLACLKSYFK